MENHKLKMPFATDKPVASFDLETTGTDSAQDRIVEIGIVRIDPPDLMNQDGCRRVSKRWLVNPGRPIPAASSAVHGITDETVKDAPKLPQIVNELADLLCGCVLVGFNATGFDVPCLWEELYRIRPETDQTKRLMLHLEQSRVIDAGLIFKRMEPRTLAAAVKKFCGRDHDKAHSAEADAAATMDVVASMALMPDLVNFGATELAEYGEEAHTLDGKKVRRVDLAGMIVRGDDGIARYTAKRVRGIPVLDDHGFGEWMLRNDFPNNTKIVLRRLFAEQYGN